MGEARFCLLGSLTCFALYPSQSRDVGMCSIYLVTAQQAIAGAHRAHAEVTDSADLVHPAFGGEGVGGLYS